MRTLSLSALGLALIASATSAHAALETFDGATVGANIGSVPGFYGTAGSQWATVNATGGVAGSRGLGGGDQGFNWTAHSFTWSTLAVGDKLTMGMDFQANSTTPHFNDDRIGWAINAGSSTSSNNHFGIQLDNEQQAGIVGYWKVSGTTIYQSIVNFSSIGFTPTTNGWYRARATFTKLGNSSAAIDVTMQALDGSGIPTGSIISGSIADTSALGGNSTPASYFAGAASPMFKNFHTTGGNADNAYFVYTAVPEPATLTVLAGAMVLVSLRRRQA